MLGRLIITTAAISITAYLVPGFIIDNLTAAVIAAIVIGVINLFIKPIIQIITLPITFLTLGLFSLVLNVLLLMLAANITPGFAIQNFTTAIIGGLVLAIITSFLNLLARN